MMGGKAQPTQYDNTTLPDQAISTAQQTSPAVLFWGKRQVAVQWITGVLDQKAAEADTGTGKK